MENTSKIYLSEKALISKLNFIKKYCTKKAKLSCVVKGNAYGHGLNIYPKLLYKNGVRHFSVFTAFINGITKYCRYDVFIWHYY